ncbi:hypothetical protein J7E88_02630 [Streptomyces sp. ISL-10]|uniref:hypothetical protein n=1 Tax=Streptomyces sp. ISL-10 TaxID=2819172 RepID=UPI001BE6812A|nr:hypothetical protein [Streptomyces sp. ISL-10]MBT2364253.1 hypothetical protein [Streptomyces sp. ISL-10]
MCTPEPPSWHPSPGSAPDGADGSADGGGVVRDAGVGVTGRGFAVVGDGLGAAVRLGVGFGVGEGVGRADTEACGPAAKSFGADCATGAVGRVEPTTKWIVIMTAVTLAAVHDSQISR